MTHRQRFYTLLPSLCATAVVCLVTGCQGPTQTAVLSSVTPIDPPAATTIPSPTASPTPRPVPTPTPVSITDASPIGYRLPLTIQHATESTATLYFELGTPSDGILLYFPISNPEEQRQVQFSAASTRQQITLTDLVPGVGYQALVGLEGDSGYQQPLYRGESWDPVTFRTPAEDQEATRVGVIGDSGFGEEATYQLASEMAGYDLDFVIHVGDLVYRMGEQSDPFEAYALKWYLPLSPLLRTVPVYPVVGNHDVEPAAFFEGMPFYYRAFPGFPDPRLPASLHEGRNQWYAFGAGNLQFLMLDTQTFYGEPGREEQDQWLAERLSDPAFAYSIGVLHVPPYSSGGLHSGDGIPVERFWVPLFVEGHVPLVLSGHSHNYERLEVNGVTYIVSGGGSSALYGEGVTHPFSRVFAVQTHFVLLEVYADRIDLTAIALGDAVIDQVTIPLG